MPARITDLDQLTDRADVLLCDVWGVIHNGVNPFLLSVEALKAARARGQTVILITNSPRPAEGVIRQFETIGVDPDCWDDIVTSGDVTRRLVQDAPRAIYFLGPERDRALVEGLDIDLVAPEAADAVLCSGLLDDENEVAEDYREMLAGFQARNLPFICANPDREVERGDRLVPCAGALADIYVELGGETRIAGKPHAPIYREAMARARALRHGVDAGRTLAIGDGVTTDIRGALDNGIPALFIARGIHARQYSDGRATDEARLHSFLESEGVAPAYWMEWLA
ncbi:MAG: TIGR01459 family HAD-type hydrolase [Hoeflea sp.]|uniref:TIGR01459 family HAD-type hydrolase n=1 Tax=Hoeflea sp. TaxID=1940281 RepID=UPI001DDF368D|nr:TIGR01459 family HAD-type hydrolase [Hoeflea sp.]MBU4529130.1 TIGR01459 family HAD-type hydrolase [Alphaproteobacteria bacterium]MBU4543535.1 TIGR01459 family HAD-type hydrolase [Alphaproteobacteria bacterium]MBU4549160.1 TIGR01459 family HAD-type hydrolase [Alphaproteobacteria bacterium]MBV1725295.1 TIGR01459 family HAD-type hydrolase [Hoeflea sp.]MBV1785256.1 TIGR01459 family HAD-type hydrolase [Hoeflea sp.]